MFKLYESKAIDSKESNKNCDYVEITTASKSENVEVCTNQQTNTSMDRRLSKPKRDLNPSDVVFPDPMSPSSSSSTSQANDATFEMTVEMMVNDFDDEQTLNEEEALAALESQDPDEEINTLKEEGEMPLEELLAKYQALPPLAFIEPSPHRKKSKKSSSKKKHRSKQRQESPSVSIEGTDSEILTSGELASAGLDRSNIKSNDAKDVESGDERDLPDEEKLEEEEEFQKDNLPNTKLSQSADDENKSIENFDNNLNRSGTNTETLKVRRTHLLDLYPEGTFTNIVEDTDAVAGNGGDIPLDILYGVEDEEDEEAEEEDDEECKKKVMIGPSYQASIPQGLSQYGDILPYENEDKLIWEPSQVTEREVEEYLLKIRDIKSNQTGEEEATDSSDETGTVSKENGHKVRNHDNIENNSLLANGEKTASLPGGTQQPGSAEDSQSVVKDNEQALHLLVQCGYDFKEALRRKRLNAMPLNDCMSLWSEEECQKFEEGIQKYGKDFLKIRQNQVRTRTMRELVQFYYLWKKSERRDHNFANADTVDHMDIYLNEDNEYGSNPASVTTPMGSPVGSSAGTTRRNSSNSQKNISIMANNCTSAISLDKNCSSHQKKRGNSNNLTTNDSSNSESSSHTTTPITPTFVATTK